ncbi:beta-propeller fold lactonase family protein [Neptunicella marina]|nr:beta-propeller fold lactonase family protein [Neptunicella marina]
MFNLCKPLPALIFLLLISANSHAHPPAGLQFIQVLKDQINGVDGLDNPRNVVASHDNRKVFITSADDNAFAVFNIGNDFKLHFSQVFKNTDSNINGLEGATGLVSVNHDNLIITSGFYDGALALFTPHKDQYQLTQTLSDNLGYDRVFDSDKPTKERDKLGILGPWEVVATRDNKQLFVAGYMSNALSVWEITADKQLHFKQFLRNSGSLITDLGKPIGLALSPANDELYVLGFDAGQIAIFNRDQQGELSAKQLIQNEVNGISNLINPQKIVVSPDGRLLFVACAGSSAILVFEKTANEQFQLIQTVTTDDVQGGLEGASSLALNAKGDTLYAAGEAGNGLLTFEITPAGKLTLKTKLPTAGEDELKNIASIYISPDN